MKQNSSGNSAWKLNPNNVSFLAKDIRNSWKLALDSLTLHLLFIHLRSSQSIRTATISQVFTSFHDLTRFLNYTRQDWRSSKIGGLLSQDLHQRLITNSVMTAHPRPPSHPRIRVTVHPLSHIFWPANCAAKSRRRGRSGAVGVAPGAGGGAGGAVKLWLVVGGMPRCTAPLPSTLQSLGDKRMRRL